MGYRSPTISKKDDNHKAIESLFNKLGWSTLDISALKNCADIVCGKGDAVKKVTIVGEIKDGDKPPSQRKLSKGEEEFRDRWRGYWFKIESIQDVIDIDRTFFGGGNGV
jgi:hypothetical protein|tara:strand:+ start:1902 stop:2228 length:327 start_codon:yes stop_codon:yes gene_type:complete